jgi:AcrR family transcriptional regulator
MDISGFFENEESESDNSPEARIRRAALACIETSGLEATTVRSIAAVAGMNLSAVNYYFRSKDRLVEEALRGAWIHMSTDIEKIVGLEGGSREKLAAAARFIIEGAYRFPRTLRAIVAEHPVLRAEVAAYSSGLMLRMAAGREGKADPAIAAALLFSFGVFLGFAPDSVSRISGLDLADEGARAALSDRVAALLFPT